MRRRALPAGQLRLALASLCLSSNLAHADESSLETRAPPAADARTDSWGGATAPGAQASQAHRLSVYFHSGLGLYLSDARTMGGLGGGGGLRDTVHERIILQADLNYLVMLGNVLELRVAGGVQRRGTYAPVALVTASGMFGDRLAFLNADHPTAVAGPAVSIGLAIAPLRFTAHGTEVSLLEVGVGAGWDHPGLGLAYHLTVLEVGTRF